MMPRLIREVVYTIGDELSFISFMMDLRRILADHPHHEDILDGHKDPNLSSTKEHPLLAKQHAEQPARWLHVKLQVKGMETSTTLLMRDDNLYVCGFMNQQGDCYELLDNKDSDNMLPYEYNPKRLHWGVKYRTILDAKDNYSTMGILKSAWMGQAFAVYAVCALSRYPEYVVPDYNIRPALALDQDYYPEYLVDDMNPRMALAGLILIVCECARMNRLHDSIVVGWANMELNGKFRDLMSDYVWEYGKMSHDLRKWKSRNYTELRGFSLRGIYLVLNTRLHLEAGNGDSHSEHLDYYGRRQRMVKGRPRVELLAMRGDLAVVGTKIIVYDGKRGQIIYTKSEHGEQGMVDLVLTGPHTGISAYGCFAIKIDIPAAGSSSGDAGGPIKWEWDCYDPEFAAEVDKPQPVTRTISSSGPGRNVEITYAVMSNALEATVQAKLRLKDGHSPAVHGKITAQVGAFQVQSVLFSREKGTGQRFSPTGSRLLQLARSVVAVQSDWVLRIEVRLQIESSKNEGTTKHLNVDLSFVNNKICSQSHEVDGDEVEVNITWYPRPDWQQEIKTTRPDISYVIGDGGGFTRFIKELRNVVADYSPCRQDVLDYQDPSARNHPVLTDKEVDYKRRRCEIKLQVEGETTTLAVRVDSLSVMGFMNKNGLWHKLGNRYDYNLPEEYKPVPLDWDSKKYGNILEVKDREKVVKILDSAELGKTFAEDAVRVLSCYPNEVAGINISARLALVGLSVIVCESAKMNPIHDTIAAGWERERGAEFKMELLDYIENWGEISRALLIWKDHSYKAWINNRQLERIGIKNAEEALGVVHLVRNAPIQRGQRRLPGA